MLNGPEARCWRVKRALPSSTTIEVVYSGNVSLLASLGDVARRVRAIPLDGGAPDLAIDGFRAAFGASLWAAHRLRRAEAGYAPEFLEYDAIGAPNLPGYFEMFRTRPSEVLLYDPERPPPEQRDRVLSLQDLRVERGAVVDGARPMLRLIGVETHDQLRVLVCDGPELLGWYGGFREKPFTAKERAALHALTPSLRTALLWKRRLARGDAARAGLEHAMEALGCPAFLLTREGSVEHANEAGRRLLADRPGSLVAELRARVASGTAESIPARGAGVSELELVVLRGPSDRLAAALARACEAWSVTKRQREVLTLLASGDTNKSIATKLGCAEVTIELHVTALLRKSGAETRTELVARVWSGDVERR